LPDAAVKEVTDLAGLLADCRSGLRREPFWLVARR
jgi:hypothetical protein